MAIELSSKAQKAMSEVELLQGEEIVNVFQADGFFLGTQPIFKMIALFQSFITTITGGHIRIFLVLTNMRCLMVQSSAVWCGCQKTKGVNVIALSGIKEAGISRETQVCCFHSRLVHVESMTERHTMIVKKFKDQDLKDFLSTLSAVIINNSKTV